jgi:ribosomal protein S18 acetylase RimI-like enzyme
MDIRFLTPADASEWQRLRLEALQGDSQAFGASFVEYESLSIDDVRRRLWSGPDAFVVGAFEKGCLCGTAGFYRDKELKGRHKGHVWGVYVTPAQRGAGIAKQVMKKLLEQAAATEGIEQVLLSVAVPQIAAVKLYRSLGFVSFGREPRALKIDGRFIDEEYFILYPKDLLAYRKPQW